MKAEPIPQTHLYPYSVGKIFAAGRKGGDLGPGKVRTGAQARSECTNNVYDEKGGSLGGGKVASS